MNHTTGAQDRTISSARIVSETVDDLISIIEDLDGQLDDAKDRIAQLEAQLEPDVGQ